MKNKIFSTLTFIIIIILIESFSFFSLLYLKNYKNIEFNPQIENIKLTKKQKKFVKYFLHGNTYRKHHEILGWTLGLKTNAFDSLYQSNSQKIRADKNYTLTPTNNKTRIATFGDSFVHGNEVAFANTWQQELEYLNPRIETLNFGVQGYGLDQAFLRYKIEGIKYHPKIVILGLIVHNMKRNLYSFRLLDYPSSSSPFAKPRYILKDDKLHLIQNPFSKISDYNQILNNTSIHINRLQSKEETFQDQRYTKSPLDILQTIRLYKVLSFNYKENKQITNSLLKNHILNNQSYAFKLTVKILEEFHNEAIKNNSTPIVLLLPTKDNINTWRKNKVDVFEPLKKELLNKSIPHLDVPDLLKSKLPLSKLLEPHKHYSAKSNKIVAQSIYKYLINNNLLEQ